MYCARIQDGSATRSTIGITRDLRSREREIWKQSLIESHAVFAIPPGSIVRDANYVVSSDAAYLWRDIKTGGPTGTSLATGCRLPLAHSPEISIFHAKKKARRQTEWKKRGRRGGGEKKNAREKKTRWVSGDRGGKERGREETTR